MEGGQTHTDTSDWPRFNKEQLGDLDFEEYRKKVLTQIAPAKGPAIVSTTEGAIQLDESWEGYIALDSLGHPYPIDSEVFEQTYEPA